MVGLQLLFCRVSSFKILKSEKEDETPQKAAEGEGNMADLKCVVENCTYNKDCLCSKGDIMVGASTPVTVTEPAVKALRRRERAGFFQQLLSHPSHTISIDCEAVKCIYNSNYKCVADHVDIKAAEPATAERPPVLLFGKVNHGKENQYSGLTNVPKLRIIEQVIGFGGRPPVHRIQ